MEVAARVDLGVIDEARRRYRRRWSALVVLAAVAVLAGGIGFAVDRSGGGLTSASVGTRPRPAHGGSHSLGSPGRCGRLLIPSSDRGRIDAVLPLCLRFHHPSLSGPGGVLPQNIVVEPRRSIADTPVRSR